MITFKLHELMGKNRIRSISQLSQATGISRLSLTRIYDGTTKGIEVQTLDTLCTFFKCSVNDLIEHVTQV